MGILSKYLFIICSKKNEEIAANRINLISIKEYLLFIATIKEDMILLLNEQYNFLKKIYLYGPIFKAEYSKVFSNDWKDLYQLTKR